MDTLGGVLFLGVDGVDQNVAAPDAEEGVVLETLPQDEAAFFDGLSGGQDIRVAYFSSHLLVYFINIDITVPLLSYYPLSPGFPIDSH